ncbi:MAG TPA: cation diffusion facilitator family transporter, partial [Puia sp.]|nr:cation diffusion facilitator family transporter [Puia sp.]
MPAPKSHNREKDHEHDRPSHSHEGDHHHSGKESHDHASHHSHGDAQDHSHGDAHDDSHGDADDHSHSHDHPHGFGHHHHPVNLEQVNRAFVIGIILNFAFVIIEVVAGLNIHSLSLLSDAGHNLADVASLAMALFAIRLLRVRATEKYTYGFKKTTILVALLNAAILLVSIGAIGY